jgi:hypothetical protein
MSCVATRLACLPSMFPCDLVGFVRGSRDAALGERGLYSIYKCRLVT